MFLNDLVDSFCYSLKNAGLKGLSRIDQSLPGYSANGSVNSKSRFKV